MNKKLIKQEIQDRLNNIELKIQFDNEERYAKKIITSLSKSLWELRL